MSNRLNYANAKRRSKARGRGESLTGSHLFHRSTLRGWRTEYPEEFPVTITRKEGQVNDQLRPIDYNGHVPGAEPEPEPSLTTAQAVDRLSSVIDRHCRDGLAKLDRILAHLESK